MTFSFGLAFNRLAIKCPSDHFRNMHSDCVSCNYLGVEEDVIESQCITKCSNREMKIVF